MKNQKIILAILTLFIAITACNQKAKENKDSITYQCPMQCEGDKTYTEEGSCPICKMDLKPVQKSKKVKHSNGEISDASIFNLDSKWKTEENQTIELKDLRGKTLVMVMIYTTCKAACPRLVADMRNIETDIPKKYSKNIQYVMVSIDPKTDTPEKLKAFAIENYMDGEHWTFLQGTEESVREFANVLAVKYKEISPMDFSHSNIISVFNPEGELIHQQEGLGVDNKATIASIMETVSPK